MTPTSFKPEVSAAVLWRQRRERGGSQFGHVSGGTRQWDLRFGSEGSPQV